MTLITPYLPKSAEVAIREWLNEDKHHAAFIAAVELGDNWIPGYCHNCAGRGVVSIKRAKAGPFKFVPDCHGAESLTWFDGDGVNGKGWYVIRDTIGFTCPHCKGEAHVSTPPEKQPIDPERRYHHPEEISAYLQESKRVLERHAKETR